MTGGDHHALIASGTSGRADWLGAGLHAVPAVVLWCLVSPSRRQVTTAEPVPSG